MSQNRKPFLSIKRNVVILAVFYTFLWGSAFPLVKICMEEMNATDILSKCFIAGIRFSFSGITLLSFLTFNEKQVFKSTLPHRNLILVYGALIAMQYGFTYLGLSNVAGSVGAIFDQLCVFLIIIFGGLFLKNDKLSLSKVLGCIFGFAGIMAVNTTVEGFTFSFSGEGMMTFAAIAQTIAYFVAVFSAKSLSAVKLVGFGQFVAGVMLLIFSGFTGASQIHFSALGILSLVSLSIISSVAYVLSLLPLKYFPASEISVFNLLITVFGVVISSLVLGEDIFRFNYLLSFVLITIGIYMVNKNKS